MFAHPVRAITRPDMKTWMTLALLLCTGCEDKKAEPTQAAPSAAPAPVVIDAAPAPAAAPSAKASEDKLLAERLKCDALMPDKSLPGKFSNFKVSQAQATCPECGPHCALVEATKPFEGIGVSYTCNQKFDPALVTSTLEPLKKSLKKPKAITEFGRGGIGGEKEAGLYYEVVVFDNDSDCFVTVDWMRGKREDTLAIAKYAIERIAQKDLQAKP